MEILLELRELESPESIDMEFSLEVFTGLMEIESSRFFEASGPSSICSRYLVEFDRSLLRLVTFVED